MKKITLLLLTGLNVMGCVRQEVLQQKLDCQPRMAYSYGMSDALLDRKMKPSYAAANHCPNDKSKLDNAYKQGYTYRPGDLKN